MGEAGVKRSRKKTAGRFGGALVLALTALALLAPADASAQIAPQPWGGNDYCSGRSAPSGVFTAANDGWSFLNIAFTGSGSLAASMWGTQADGCFRPSQPTCSSNCQIEAQALCEFHCQHDHTPPYPWIVRLAPTSGFVVSWAGTTCVPAKDAPQSDCIVQMAAPGGTTTATARFAPAPDAVPPAPAPSVSVSGVGSYTMNVSWSPSNDDNWLGGYDIYNGATRLLRVGPFTTSTRLEALSCQTTYNIRVEAFDTANRTPSNTVAARTGACIGSSDTRAPNTVFHVKPPKVTRSRTASFHFGATERSRFRCKLDRRVWAKCKLSDPYVLSMGKTYRRLKPGYHTFRVRAVDRAGNVDRTPAVYRWRIRR